MRVLLIETSSIANTMRALPVLDYLYKVRPDAEIGWVVDDQCKEILDGNTLISRIHPVRSRDWKSRPLSPATLFEVSRLRRDLLSCGYDIVFDLESTVRSGIVAFLSGAPRKFGAAAEYARDPLNRYFITSSVMIRRQDYHMTDHCLRIVSSAFGREYNDMQLMTDIQTSRLEDDEAEAYLATLGDGFVVLIHPGSSRGTKLWHEDGWIELGKRVLAEFPESSLLVSASGRTERALAEKISAGVGRHARVLPAVSLKRLAAVMKKVDLVAGCDSGPVHIAAAAGTPTLSLYRATDSRRNAPRGESHISIQAPMQCTACMKMDCDRDKDCRSSISVEMMFEGVRKLLMRSSENDPEY